MPSYLLRFFFLFSVSLLAWPTESLAHHVLGRPAYSLNEDSNTPSRMQMEVRIGKYEITLMTFPAFLKPNEYGRINLYASRLSDGVPFEGTVSFSVVDTKWWGEDEEEQLGVQPVDATVFRQGFVFGQAGEYIIRARFDAEGEPYLIDFPIQVGVSSPIGPLGILVVCVLLLLIVVRLLNRRRYPRRESPL